MKYLLLASLVCVAACSSQPLEGARYYLLRSQVPVATGQSAAAPVFALAAVRVAAYLDQSGLVLETGAGEIHMARLHQWAEPLRLSLPGFLASEIGAALGQPVSTAAAEEGATRIEVSIDQLHGKADGSVILVAFWRATSAAGAVVSGQFAESARLSADGYAALVEAENTLLKQLSRRIGGALR